MAIAFAILFVFNVVRSIRHPTYVLVVLSIFCLSESPLLPVIRSAPNYHLQQYELRHSR